MLNTCTIMGRLVADPNVRQTGNGITCVNFRIACDRNNTTENGQKADFIDCVAWRKTGEFISKYFNKGKPILIEGRLQIRDYVDKDNNKRKSAEILVNEAHFCGGDKVQPVANVNEPIQNAAPPVITPLDLDDDDIPF